MGTITTFQTETGTAMIERVKSGRKVNCINP